jgi:hypothetical protein
MGSKNRGGIAAKTFFKPLAQGIDNPKNVSILHLFLTQRDDAVDGGSRALSSPRGARPSDGYANWSGCEITIPVGVGFAMW